MPRRIIVAPDTTVFSFDTDNAGKADPKSSDVLFFPQRAQRLHLNARKASDEYMRVEKDATTETMVVAHYINDQQDSVRSIEELDGIPDFKAIIPTTTGNYFERPGGEGFIRYEIEAGEPGKWSIRYTRFVGGVFADPSLVEYAMDLPSFLTLWSRYQLPVFGLLSGNVHSRVSLGDLVPNRPRIYSGNYDGLPCIVKRATVTTTLGHIHRYLKNIRLINDQSNMVRVYDARCDGENYELAMETCSNQNLAELILERHKKNAEVKYKDTKANFRELLRLSREIAIGVTHAHRMGISHNNICPKNIVIKEYPTQLDVPKLCGWSRCSKLEGNETRDLYHIGLMILRACLHPGVTYSDDSYWDMYLSKEKKNQNLEDDLKLLKQRNPLVFDLVSCCLDSKRNNFTALDIVLHYAFWVEGRHLHFLQRASDEMKTNNNLRRNVNSQGYLVFDSSGWDVTFRNAKWFSGRSKAYKTSRTLFY